MKCRVGDFSTSIIKTSGHEGRWGKRGKWGQHYLPVFQYGFFLLYSVDIFHDTLIQVQDLIQDRLTGHLKKEIIMKDVNCLQAILENCPIVLSPFPLFPHLPSGPDVFIIEVLMGCMDLKHSLKCSSIAPP